MLHTIREIAFIASDIPDSQTLISGIKKGIETAILDPNRDAIAQIGETIKGKKYSAIHIICHGAGGHLQLGNTALNIETLPQYTQQIQQWRESLSAEASILLYGCNVAQSVGATTPTYLRIIDNSNKPAPTPPCGNQFLTQLHQLTGAFIVANPNPTGNSERGGTWKLTSSIPPSPQAPKLALTETALKTYSGILGFAPKVDFPTGAFPRDVSIGDFNGDGSPDVATTNNNSYTTSILINTTPTGATTPTFAPKVDFPTGLRPASVSIGDFNGDGSPDVAVANPGSNTTSILINTTATGATTPTFAPKVDLNTGVYPFSVSIGDFNGDGKPDVAVTNFYGHSTSILLNNTPKVSIAAGTTPTETGPTNGTFTITLDTPAPEGGLVVNFNTIGSTATNPSHYSLSAGTNITAVTANTFTIAAGATTAVLNAVPVDDAIINPGETIKVNVTADTNNWNYFLDPVFENTTATLTITDNDDIPTVNLSVSPATTTETGSPTLTVTATASSAVVGAQTLDVNLSGTATDEDFTGEIPASITIADGETTGSFTVNINDDGIVEGSETGTFTISNPSSGIVLGTTTTGEVTITEDDCICDDIDYPNLNQPNPVENTILGGSTIQIGTALNDEFLGSNSANIFDGRAGDDNLYGGAISDILNGNKGNDFISGGNGDDILSGDENNDIILGDLGEDLIWGGKGKDSLSGGEGNDLIRGEDNNDFIDGDMDNDTLFGGKGDDIMLGSQGDDYLFGNQGWDTICGGEGNDLISGNEQADILGGCEGNDTLYAGESNDTLTGGQGDDILYGEWGNDSLTGGSGNDIFVLNSGQGFDRIADFTLGQDLIGLSSGLSFDQLAITQNTQGTIIKNVLTGEELGVMIGVSANAITSANFLLI